jgi:hemolysin activation/secretion protein
MKSQLHDSLIGDEVVVRGFRGHATLGDHGELAGEG